MVMIIIYYIRYQVELLLCFLFVFLAICFSSCLSFVLLLYIFETYDWLQKNVFSKSEAKGIDSLIWRLLLHDVQTVGLLRAFMFYMQLVRKTMEVNENERLS